VSGKVVVTGLKELTPVIESCVAEGSQVVLTVTGNSMRPLFFHRRDQVVLERCDPARLQVGDIPLYRRDRDTFILHRVVGLGASTYVMCGDGQWKKEYGVPYSAVIAVVTGFYRKGKYISCDSPKYRRYVRFWLSSFPFRRFLLCCDDLARRVVRFVRRIFVR
jgi:hypothetical protein